LNTYQIMRQLRYLLLSRNWTSSSNKVFGSGSIHITPALPVDAKATLRIPCALMFPATSQVDPQHNEEPDLINQEIVVTLIAAVPGDQLGQKTMIGGNIPDRTKSEGRGILELEEELFGGIEFLNTDTGIVIQHSASREAKPVLDQDFGYVIYRDHYFRAWATADRFYHPCIKFSATGAAGSVSLSWGLPPDRFDRFRVMLRRATGTTAPSSVDSGSAVALSGNLATSATDTISAGTYSYALFAQYDETNDAPAQTLSVADRTSSLVTQSSIVVT